MSERNVSPSEFGKKLSPKIVVIVVAVIILLIIAFSSFYTVDQKEVAVLLTLCAFTVI